MASGPASGRTYLGSLASSIVSKKSPPQNAHRIRLTSGARFRFRPDLRNNPTTKSAVRGRNR